MMTTEEHPADSLHRKLAEMIGDIAKRAITGESVNADESGTIGWSDITKIIAAVTEGVRIDFMPSNSHLQDPAEDCELTVLIEIELDPGKEDGTVGPTYIRREMPVSRLVLLDDDDFEAVKESREELCRSLARVDMWLAENKP